MVTGLVVERAAPNALLIRRADESCSTVDRPSVAGVSVAVSEGAGQSPESVAGVLVELALEKFVLVPATGMATHAWLAEVALRAGRDIVFATDQAAFRPFPTVLCQPMRGGDQRVVEVAAPPPGWARDGVHSYRSGDVVAEVVPSGLVVRGTGGEPADGVLPFDPAGWTLWLGVPGEPVGLAVVVAAERLLDWLGPDQRAVAKARVLGHLDPDARKALERSVRPRGPARPAAEPRIARAPGSKPVAVAEAGGLTGPAMSPAVPASEPVSESVPVVERAVAPESRPVPAVVSASVPEAEHPPMPEPEPQALPVLAAVPPIVTISSAPVSTVSNGAPAEPVSQQEPPREPEPAPEAPPAAVHQVQPALPVAPAPPVIPVQPGTGPLSVPDRVSTSAEQTRFTAAAGEAFSEALAAVNAALATWPSLRQGASNGFKADLVAVCLYLSRDQAAQVNAAVRSGQPAPVDAHIPCLASGIRRLPTHRSAVLRQSVDSTDYRGAPGTVLTEPGFLTASMDLDITVPGAELDVLIWPASARRTAELLAGRPVNEAVFVAGARFKALAVRTAEEQDDAEGPVAPRVAALFRELAPSEQAGTELDERDQAVLAKLDRILARRQKRTLRLVDEPDLTSRLTASMVEWQPAERTVAAS